MKSLIIAIAAVGLLLVLASMPEAACNVCHSKNPKMQAMHQALQYKDCFKCHGMGQIKKSPEERSRQMTSDPLCIACHKK